MIIKYWPTALTAVIALAVPIPASAQNYPQPYYPPVPQPIYAPNPIASIVGGILSLPFVVVGGVVTGITGAVQPPEPMCVYEGGQLAPCPEPPPPAPNYYAPAPQAPPPEPMAPVSKGYSPALENRSGGCYSAADGRWIGDGNPECSP
jgi:hypothetical protein